MNKALNILKYSLMILIVLLSIYIWFFETENFCIESRGQVDKEDEGKKCFATLTEANQYKAEMIGKYRLNETREIEYFINISE